MLHIFSILFYVEIDDVRNKNLAKIHGYLVFLIPQSLIHIL